jgi:hypothetical protein
MSDFISRGLLGLLFIFLALDSLAQSDSVSKNVHDANKLKGDTAFPVFIKIAANPQLKGSGFKRSLTGRNYRKEWTTPIKVAVLNLNTAYGGLVPTKEGGGKQTKSLRVEDHAGKEWALRSVEKFPEKAVPPTLRKTVAEKIVKDGISASYPYGVLSMEPLSRAANVLYLKDTLVYIPDDPALGEFRSKFKNTLVLMEEKEPSTIPNVEGKREKLLNTLELCYMLANDNNSKVDQSAVLRARLLDNFVMDFDRHLRQWDWLGIKSAEGRIYYPVPTDRDQAFYNNDGSLSKLLTFMNVLPQLQGFKKKAKNIQTFNFAEQGFDRLFLNSLTEEEWNKQIDEFLNLMTDEVIEAAMRKQPLEIQDYSAVKIKEILKAKRQYFKADMMKYYRFLSKTVSIAGTNARELFTILKDDNGKISLVVNTIDSTGNISTKLYERIFDPEVTSELRIYGLEGDDKFVLEGGKSKIKTRIIGGPGNDEFVNNGNSRKVVLYDVSFEENKISGGDIHKNISSDPQNNNYNRLEYLYNRFLFSLSMEYTIGGLFLGPKVKIIKQGFRKDPYSATHLIAVNRAINSSSYHLRYYADFIHLFGKTDLLFRSDVWLPTSRTEFFGLGNNTVFEKTKTGGFKYYFDYYNLVNVALLARKRVNSWFQFSYGSVFQHFRLKAKPNENKYIATVYLPESDLTNAYAGKSFAGGELSLEINTKNSQAVPTRGIKLNMYGRSLAGLNKYSNPVTETGGQLNLYTDFIAKRHVVLATSFGASYITGKFELQQAQYLGFRHNLRGFRIDRFAGRSRAYNNSEIRFLKRDANLGLFRGTLGLLVFNDIARVWTDNEKSTQWHDGYGGGLVIAPLDMIVITAVLMYSKEEKNLMFINFGFQF